MEHLSWLIFQGQRIDLRLTVFSLLCSHLETFFDCLRVVNDNYRLKLTVQEFKQ